MLFVLIQLLTVLISTLRTILTVSASKEVASLINAFGYTLGAVLTKYIANTDFLIVIVSTFLTNLFGVYIAKIIIEKTRKERLWIVWATIKKENKEKLEEDLRRRGIQYTLMSAENNRVYFSIFSNSKGESILLKEILKTFEARYNVLESLGNL